MKNKKRIITIIGVVLAVIIIGFILLRYNSNRQEQNRRELAELKEQKIQLEVQKNEIFFKDGFSSEYYHINDELTEINKQINKKELSTGPSAIFFTIFGLIFVTIFGTTVITIFKSARNHHNISTNVTVSDHTTDQIEKMATMLGKVAVDMAKEMNPEYKSLKCPNCGANLTDDVEVCEYCDAPLTKVVATGKRK